MQRRAVSFGIGLFAVGALLAPLLIDDLLAEVIPFFNGFGPDFVRRLGGTYLVLTIANGIMAHFFRRIRFNIGIAVAAVATLIVITILKFRGADVFGDGDLLIAISHTVPYLFSLAQTTRERFGVSVTVLLLPLLGYITLETFDGTPPGSETLVFAVVGIIFGLPLAILGFVSRPNHSKDRLGQ